MRWSQVLKPDATARALFDDPAALTAGPSAYAAASTRILEMGIAPEGDAICAKPAVIPRNHLVESAIDAAVTRQDFRRFHELVEVPSTPWHKDRREFEHYAQTLSGRWPLPDVLRNTSCARPGRSAAAPDPTILRDARLWLGIPSAITPIQVAIHDAKIQNIPDEPAT